MSRGTKRPVIRSDGKRYPSIAEASRQQQVPNDPENIGMCCRGKRKTACGYGWRYDDGGDCECAS